MSDDNNKTDKIVGAVTELVKAVPVYQDLAQPAAREIGKNLEIIAKTASIVLAPLKALVWTWDKLEDFIETKVSIKLEGTKKEDIVAPDPKTVVPALEAVRYTSDEDEDLQNMYASLIASAMDNKTKSKTHPAYASIIKSFSTDDAIITKYFKEKTGISAVDVEYYEDNKNSNFIIIVECMSTIDLKCVEIRNHQRIIKSVNNLMRLGIVEKFQKLASNDLYSPLEEQCNESARVSGYDISKLKFSRYSLKTTAFGKDFLASVIR